MDKVPDWIAAITGVAALAFAIFRDWPLGEDHTMMTTRSAKVSAAALAAIALPLAWATPRATPAIAITSWMLLGCATLAAVRYERRHQGGRRG